MPRPTWKGHLSFGLVMIPAVLYPAESPTARLDLDLLDARDHSRVRYKRVNEKTGDEVPWDRIVKGHKRGDGYVILEPQDFERSAQDVVRGVEIVEFVDAASISPVLFEKPYFIEPAKGGEKAYALLRETLRDSGRAGIARAVLQSREHLAALLPLSDVLTLITLRFNDEMRKPEDVEAARGRGSAAGGKVSAQEIDIAKKLVEGMSAPWKPEKYRDTCHDALRAVIEGKAEGRARPLEPEKPTRAPASADIMDLLKASLGRHQARERRRPEAPPARRGRRPRPPAKKPARR